MEQELALENIPFGYYLCLNESCPLKGTCLRWLAGEAKTRDEKYWSIISPKYQATLSGRCPDYRPNRKVIYAKGFLKMLGRMSVNQSKSVIVSLISLFGQRTYYRVRKGERLLSPVEQQRVLNVLKRHGVSLPQEFDAYIEEYDW